MRRDSRATFVGPRRMEDERLNGSEASLDGELERPEDFCTPLLALVFSVEVNVAILDVLILPAFDRAFFHLH
ncbi:hypothetical protein K402DRAFT_65348 [Aulographum hederae CBS 113979]|uniref:Uncharacterized protein n=1 Tax=Aulographum hederae CBS 113979 TaxID=1176131 RepID=A0A6G1H0K1_9PEZI|nr:hypothetical protein K402DRAFT_65348 [Aulographum hederae CBS 113979]